MAIPTWQANGATEGSATAAITPLWPSHVADDIGLLIVESANETISLTDAQGFVAVTGAEAGVGTAGNTNATRLKVYWCRATSGAMSGPTIPDLGNHSCARIVTFRGCITSGDPWDVVATADTDAGNTAVSIPGATTTVADCLVAAICAHGIDAAAAQFSSPANSDLASVTERADNGTAQGNGGGIVVVCGEKATAGSYGATTGTLASSAPQARVSIALKPPAAGGATVTPGKGDLTLAGFAPTVSSSSPVTVTPGKGDLTLAGNAPTIGLPVTVTPGKGDLTLAGNAPTIGLPVTVSPSKGDLTLAGNAPTIGLPVTVTPGKGDLTLAGNAPTIVTSAGNPVTVSPCVGDGLIITGYAPTIETFNAVLISPGTNINTTITGNPSATVFQLQDGLHRITSAVAPRAGITIRGQSQAGTILSGAIALHASTDATAGSFVADGATGRYYITGQTQQGSESSFGTCQPGFPECHQPEDLWIDDVLQVPQTNITDVTGPGLWHFDYGANKIYIWGSPANKQVETSVEQSAVTASVDNVTLSNFTIEKFATKFQDGAVSGLDGGENWHLQNMLIRDVHGIGVQLTKNWRITGGRITRCGQMGFSGHINGSTKSTGIIVDGVEVDGNGVSGVNPGAAAGACKMTNTDGAIVRNCYVHDNPGNGIWYDIDNEDGLVEYNRVYDNGYQGIFFEISYGGIVRFNDVRRNGFDRSNSLGFGAGIFNAATTDLEVYGNYVEDCHNGIAGAQQDRGSGTKDGVSTLHVVRGFYVHDNYVVLAQTGGDAQRVGLWSDFVPPGASIFAAASNNRWRKNTYDLSAATASPFRWDGANRTFAQWQSDTQDPSWNETRFYFDSATAPSASPTISDGWEVLPPANHYRRLNRTKQNSAFTNRNVASGIVLGEDVLWHSFVYESLAAQTISGTVKGMIRARQPNAAADARVQIRAKVMSSDGLTERGVLVDYDDDLDDPPSSELITSTSVFEARKIPRGWTGDGQIVDAVDAQAGDLLVVEIGYRHMESCTTRSCPFETGDPTSSGDLTESETDQTQAAGWIEFSAEIVDSGSAMLAPGAGDITLAGFAPTITIPDPLTVSPGVGSVVLGGFAATISTEAARRGKGGFKRILYDPKGAQEEIDARPDWSPDDLGPLEAHPLPEPGPLPESSNTEPTKPVRLPKRRQQEIRELIAAGATPLEIVDDEEEIDFILNIMLDLD